MRGGTPVQITVLKGLITEIWSSFKHGASWTHPYMCTSARSASRTPLQIYRVLTRQSEAPLLVFPERMPSDPYMRTNGVEAALQCCHQRWHRFPISPLVDWLTCRMSNASNKVSNNSVAGSSFHLGSILNLWLCSEMTDRWESGGCTQLISLDRATLLDSPLIVTRFDYGFP